MHLHAALNQASPQRRSGATRNLPSGQTGSVCLTPGCFLLARFQYSETSKETGHRKWRRDAPSRRTAAQSFIKRLEWQARRRRRCSNRPQNGANQRSALSRVQHDNDRPNPIRIEKVMTKRKSDFFNKKVLNFCAVFLFSGAVLNWTPREPLARLGGRL